MPSDPIILAREAAASLYPAVIVDSLGREHVPAPRRAILSGAWDTAPIVLKHMAKNDGE